LLQGKVRPFCERTRLVEKEKPARRPIRIEQSPLERARLWVEIIAFAAAGCWAIYTFLYQTRIAPALVPAHEVLAVSVERLASSPVGTIQQVRLTIKNDGAVDVDTAAFALDVYGAAAVGLRWHTVVTHFAIRLHEPTPGSWRILQALAFVGDGALAGKPNSHILLRPGDSFDIPVLVTVPRYDHLLRVYVDTAYARYPIRPRMAVRLARLSNGRNRLSRHVSVDEFRFVFRRLAATCSDAFVGVPFRAFLTTFVCPNDDGNAPTRCFALALRTHAVSRI
jgi:hypothetical protein